MLLEIILLAIISIIICGIALIIFPRVLIYASFEKDSNRFYASLRMLGFGALYDSQRSQFGALLFGREKYFAVKGAGVKTGKKDLKRKESGREDSAVRKKKAKTKRKLPAVTWVKIGRAGILFAARILARIKYEEALVEYQPVLANPAVAGMTYGWSRALAGIFPGFGRVVNYNPVFRGNKSKFTGNITLSLKNRQIAYALFQMLREMPIKEIIRYRFFSKEEKENA